MKINKIREMSSPDLEKELGETVPYSFESEYRLLSRLKSDCEYFLGEGARAEKHLWAGSVDKQIEKMRELYEQLPEKPEWLSNQDIDNYERQMQDVTPEQTKERYEYHLGSTVYIGANEYEIQSFDDERVMLYDLQFPLFNKEMTRAEFDQKVQENPMNDHLKVKVTEVEQGTETPDIPFASGDTHYFYRPDSKRWDAVYYNPDANSGGQYVVTHLSLEEVISAKENSDSVESFFENLYQAKSQELIDLGTLDYDEFIREYGEMHADRIGDDEGTMETLVSEARSELEQVPVYDRESEIIYDVLSALKIDDVTLDFDGDELIATDSMGNEWHGQEFYKFLVEEAFVFEDDGSVLGIRNELLKDFTELSEHNGVPVKDNRVREPYRSYLAVKAENPDRIVFYQVGDFFECYNDDAQKAAEAQAAAEAAQATADANAAEIAAIAAGLGWGTF